MVFYQTFLSQSRRCGFSLLAYSQERAEVPKCIIEPILQHRTQEVEPNFQDDEAKRLESLMVCGFHVRSDSLSRCPASFDSWSTKSHHTRVKRLSQALNRSLRNPYHVSGVWYMDADEPKQDCSMSVLMTPGFRATAMQPRGSSRAKERDMPSTPHLVVQYGATCGESRTNSNRPSSVVRTRVSKVSRA